MRPEERLAALGITLPEVPKPVAAYVPAVAAGPWVWTSGQLPVRDGQLVYRGRLGEEVDLDSGYQAARLAAINCLAALKAQLGELDRIARVVMVAGYVASAPGFCDQSKVVNGASELLADVFGDAGAHARIAVGVAQLPLGAPVEIQMMVLLKEQQ